MPETLPHPFSEIFSKNAEAETRPLSLEPVPAAPDQEHLRVESRLGYAVYDLTGLVQQGRGKENKIYTDINTGTQYFAKYVSQSDNSFFNDVEGMAQEKLLLDYLAPTGVVPKTGVFRVYPNEKRARLLLERLSGQSLDDQELLNVVKERQVIFDVIIATAEALQKVHDSGVVVGDLNLGTFLVDIDKTVPEVKILDLEIGCHVEDSPERLQRLATWCSRQDIGVRNILDRQNEQVDEELLMQIELHRWGKTMSSWLLGDPSTWPNRPLSPEEQQRTIEAEAYIKEKLLAIIEEDLRRRYKTYYEPRKKLGFQIEDEDEFVVNELSDSYQEAIKKEVCQANFKIGVQEQYPELPASLVAFIASTLDVDPAKRPHSFYPLIS